MCLSVQKAHLRRSIMTSQPALLAPAHPSGSKSVNSFQTQLNISTIMKTILSLIALAAISGSAFAGEACKKCCADKNKTCATCCKDAGKACGKDCCKEKEK